MVSINKSLGFAFTNSQTKKKKEFLFIQAQKNSYGFRKIQQPNILFILKILKKENKISKNQYRNTIKNIINKKPISQIVKNHIYFYSQKQNKQLYSSKNSLTAITTKANYFYKRFCFVSYLNNMYYVYIKKGVYNDLFINKYLNSDYKNVMESKIKKEFIKLLNINITEINKIVFANSPQQLKTTE